MLYRTLAHFRRRSYLLGLPLLLILLSSTVFLPNSVLASSATSSYNVPTWWAKYQTLLKGNSGSAATSQALSVAQTLT